jgi:hypothetical protein
MTRKSMREIERLVEELEEQSPDQQFDPEEMDLTSEQKQRLAEDFSVDDVYTDEPPAWFVDFHERWDGETL